MSETLIPMPEGGDVVEIILDDHRTFEELLRRLRDVTADRARALEALSALLVAHAEAEESKVYPRLRRKDAIDEEEVEHSEHEHDEGHEALLALLELDGPDADGFLDAVEDLSEKLSHHLDEEERDVLNPARTEVSDEDRAALGGDFVVQRRRLLASGCGSVDTVRSLVHRAQKSDDRGA